MRELLDARGVPSVALDLPMTTLDRDAAVLSAALAEIEGDAIVVSHSWGGSVATLGAIGAPNVRHLIYLAAVLTEAGHPTLSPPSSVPVKGRETLRPKVVIETDTTTIIDREVSLAAFYHDVEPSLARQAASRLRPFQKTGYAVIETDGGRGVADDSDDLRGVRRRSHDPSRYPARDGGRSGGRGGLGVALQPLAVPLTSRPRR